MEVKLAKLIGRVKRMLPAGKKIYSMGFENMDPFMPNNCKQLGTEKTGISIVLQLR